MMRTLAADIRLGLRSAPARAGLTFLSLWVGLFSVVVLLAVLDALRLEARNLAADFGAASFAIARAGGAEASPWSRGSVEFFRANLGASARVGGVRHVPGTAGDGFAVLAVDAELASARGWRAAEGRVFDELDMRSGARHALAFEALCRRQGWRAGDWIAVGRESFRLVGCLAGADAGLAGLTASAVFIPYTLDALDDGPQPARDEVDTIWFRTTGGGDPAALQRRVAALLRQPGFDARQVEWITLDTLLEGIRRWQRIIAWTAGATSLLGLVLGAVMLASMLLTGVRERVPEIGLRRALGARRRDIALLFVVEGLLLALVSGAAALAAAELALRGLGGAFPLPWHLGWPARLLPLVVAGGIALVCSVVPATRAAQLPPADALRNE
ncbi:MAG: ABC transporter permease [Lentisphaerae bacterium]|nr:ABC transporter permease [Lentisphaerota bacterium]